MTLLGSKSKSSDFVLIIPLWEPPIRPLLEATCGALRDIFEMLGLCGMLIFSDSSDNKSKIYSKTKKNSCFTGP